MSLLNRLLLVCLCFFTFGCLANTGPARAEQKPEYVTGKLGLVDISAAFEVIKGIGEANRLNVPYILVIDSPGGAIPAGLLIVDFIKSSRVPVACMVDGHADSMAMVILQVCNVRLATPKSTIMFHRPSASITGNEDSLKEAITKLQGLYDLLTEIIADGGKKDHEAVKQACYHDCVYTVKEAIKEGYLDGTVTP